MRASQTTKVSPAKTSKKPAIAFTSETTALQNLKVKIEAMRAMLGNNDPNELKHVPSSIRQFNLWASESLPASAHGFTFVRNAAETLRRHPSLMESVQALAIQVQTTRKQGASPPQDRVAKLKRDKELHRVLREIAERELILARRDTARWRSKTLELQAKLLSLEEICAQKLREHEQALEELRAKNAELVSLARKVLPLRGRQ